MQDRYIELRERILDLKGRRQAVILAHNYQSGEVQDIADFVGDSLDLSQKAAKTDAKVIVFCGVHFMAETASILSPDKTVLLPDINAGCPMANMITAGQLRDKKRELPYASTVCYVNSSAEVKAESDICCTSANAVRVIESLDTDEILFVPDQYLGHYISTTTDKKIILWSGYCPTHARIMPWEITRLKQDYPNENPDKKFIAASKQAVCPNMKRITLEKILWSLEELSPEVKVPEDIRLSAKSAVAKMLEIGRGD